MLNGEIKKRFKMYKAGKLWLVGATAFLSIGAFAVADPSNTTAAAADDAGQTEAPAKSAQASTTTVPLHSAAAATTAPKAATGTDTSNGDGTDTAAKEAPVASAPKAASATDTQNAGTSQTDQAAPTAAPAPAATSSRTTADSTAAAAVPVAASTPVTQADIDAAIARNMAKGQSYQQAVEKYQADLAAYQAAKAQYDAQLAVKQQRDKEIADVVRSNTVKEDDYQQDQHYFAAATAQHNKDLTKYQDDMQDYHVLQGEIANDKANGFFTTISNENPALALDRTGLALIDFTQALKDNADGHVSFDDIRAGKLEQLDPTILANFKDLLSKFGPVRTEFESRVEAKYGTGIDGWDGWYYGFGWPDGTGIYDYLEDQVTKGGYNLGGGTHGALTLNYHKHYKVVDESNHVITEDFDQSGVPEELETVNKDNIDDAIKQYFETYNTDSFDAAAMDGKAKEPALITKDMVANYDNALDVAKQNMTNKLNDTMQSMSKAIDNYMASGKSMTDINTLHDQLEAGAKTLNAVFLESAENIKTVDGGTTDMSNFVNSLKTQSGEQLVQTYGYRGLMTMMDTAIAGATAWSYASKMPNFGGAQMFADIPINDMINSGPFSIGTYVPSFNAPAAPANLDLKAPNAPTLDKVPTPIKIGEPPVAPQVPAFPHFELVPNLPENPNTPETNITTDIPPYKTPDNPNLPDTDGPENPNGPETPDVPDNPDEPNLPDTFGPGTDGSSTSKTDEPGLPDTFGDATVVASSGKQGTATMQQTAFRNRTNGTVGRAAKAANLPQTGDGDARSTSIIGLALAGLLTLLGLGERKRKLS